MRQIPGPTFIEELLLSQIIEDAEESRQIGCDPSVFLALVQEHGPVEACKLIITDPELGQDLLRVKQAGRLDLTVEALVLRDRFKRLFDDNILGRARKRIVDWSQPSSPKRRQ